MYSYADMAYPLADALVGLIAALMAIIFILLLVIAHLWRDKRREVRKPSQKKVRVSSFQTII